MKQTCQTKQKIAALNIKTKTTELENPFSFFWKTKNKKTYSCEQAL